MTTMSAYRILRTAAELGIGAKLSAVEVAEIAKLEVQLAEAQREIERSHEIIVGQNEEIVKAKARLAEAVKREHHREDDENEWECEFGDKCLMPSYFHRRDECYTVEMAQDWENRER